MIKRTVEISTHGSYVHAKHSQLVVEKDGEKIGTCPIEDLCALIIESPQVTFSSSLMAKLAEENVAVIFTDSKHLPASLTIPFSAHSIQSKIINQQIAISQPLKKRTWASVVSGKILNQSKALEACGKDGTTLREISKNIPSGDPKNLEAFAARIYWKKLFNDDFRRNREKADANMLLNYGYAIMRAASARAIVGTGLYPGLGINHKNQYNPFPLADDLMEPLRPFIDVRVFQIVQKHCEESGGGEPEFELNRSTKSELLRVIAEDCKFDDKKMPLLAAIGMYAASLKQIIMGEEKKLLIPYL